VANACLMPFSGHLSRGHHREDAALLAGASIRPQYSMPVRTIARDIGAHHFDAAVHLSGLGESAISVADAQDLGSRTDGGCD
jgi:hypothetical protein